MAALNVLEPKKQIEFTRLRALVQATDGNLGAHLETLAQAGYITIGKRFAGKKPQTLVRATGAGRRAFVEHAAYLLALLEEPGEAGQGREV